MVIPKLFNISKQIIDEIEIIFRITDFPIRVNKVATSLSDRKHSRLLFSLHIGGKSDVTKAMLFYSTLVLMLDVSSALCIRFTVTICIL